MIAQRATRPIEVLLVEDNPGDVLLTQEAFEEAEIAVALTVCEDAPTALEHLVRRSAADDTSTPDLILLDMELPGPSGLRVLEEIEVRGDLSDVPVVVVSGFGAPDSLRASHRRRPVGYIRKPIRAGALRHAVRELSGFDWLRSDP